MKLSGGLLLERALVTVCDTESFHMGYDSDSRYKLSECNWILECPADVWELADVTKYSKTFD